MIKELVFVGLSGGVDSAVAAKRLIEEGKRVVGVFIRTWHPDFIVCNEELDRLDAMRVAAHLNVPFLTFDAVDVYKKEVADYMIAEYRAGRTPNPDVMCNEHVKFGAFLDFALKEGANKVATGHYARIEYDLPERTLLRGVDETKDQSYFLWKLTEAERKKIYFPVGDSRKEDIRAEAKRAGIPIAAKPDSQGICFLGHVNMREFLSHYIELVPGTVLSEDGNVIGTHHGAVLYTLGQRHGFTLTTKGSDDTPQYVTHRDIEKNTITVGSAPRTVTENQTQVRLSELNLSRTLPTDGLTAQFRYRQKPFPVSLSVEAVKTRAILTVHDEHIEVPSPGQSCVLYKGDVCLGGGIIE